MNPRILEILQHTLGCDQYGRGTFYRNHFVAGGKDDQQCEELVALGFMAKHPRRGGENDELTGGMPCYSVTNTGKEAMIQESPKAPRPKRTPQFESWQTYCEVFSRIPFGKFLKEVWPHRDQYSR